MENKEPLEVLDVLVIKINSSIKFDIVWINHVVLYFRKFLRYSKHNSLYFLVDLMIFPLTSEEVKDKIIKKKLLMEIKYNSTFSNENQETVNQQLWEKCSDQGLNIMFISNHTL